MRLFAPRRPNPARPLKLDSGAQGGPASAASLTLDQARLDEARELSDPESLVLAADLRRRQEELDRRTGRPPVERPPEVSLEAPLTPDKAPRGPAAGAHSEPVPEQPVPEPAVPVLEAGKRRSRLIIADDDPVALAMLEGSLSRSFEIVGIATDGEYVVELARQHHPDAALVDLEMPGGGGMAAVKGIVEVSPATAIVVLSADESDGTVRELMRAGAMAYRRKGGSQVALTESLTGAINVKSGPQPVPPARLPSHSE